MFSKKQWQIIEFIFSHICFNSAFLIRCHVKCNRCKLTKEATRMHQRRAGKRRLLLSPLSYKSSSPSLWIWCEGQQMVRIQHGAENMKKIMSYIQKACLYDFRKISILSAIPMGGPFIVSKPYLNQLIPPPNGNICHRFPFLAKRPKGQQRTTIF